MLIDRLVLLLEDPGAEGGGGSLPDLLLRGVSALGKNPAGSTCLHNQPGTVRPLRFLPGQGQYENGSSEGEVLAECQAASD